MNEMMKTMEAAASGMRAQGARMRLSSENIANVDTPGYRRKTVTFEETFNSTRDARAVKTGAVNLDRSELPEFEALFARRDATSGYVSNSILTMGRRPEILRAYQGLLDAAYNEGTVDHRLKALVALMRSSAAGCRYCMAHTANHGASEFDIDAQKIERIWEFETSDLFSDAERAALRLARDAAQLPNAATEDHFVELRKYFDDGEIIEIVAVISMFAFLNSWNDTLATPLEAAPVAFAQGHLGSMGWEVGKHA